MTKETISAVDFEALPEFRIGGETRVVTDPKTGHSTYEREPQKFLLHKGAYYVSDNRGMLWEVFTDQDGKTWRQRGI